MKSLKSILLTLFAVLLTLTFSSAYSAPKTGEVHLLTFQKGAPLKGVEVFYQNKKLGATDVDGSLFFDLPVGEQKVQLVQNGNQVAELTLVIEASDTAELIIPITEKATVTDIISESKSGNVIKQPDAAGAVPVAGAAAAAKVAEKKPEGIISGQITSVETKAGIPGVSVYLTGVDQKIMTDAEGFFSAKIPEGKYTLSAVHGDYSAQTIKNILLQSNKQVNQNLELTPAAEQLKEFVVTAPYLAGGVLALVEEKKQTSAVAEVISAEEVSKSGDSTAASALSRVTGLTLVDGKYIYVRGMGDRYSSVRLNGSGLPSPEPSKSTIPLDMFPSGMIGSVLVQKTYSPNLPGDFGGGTVLLRTKQIPEEQSNKFSIALGGNSRSTGKDGLTYRGGGTDELGIDDGTRALSSSSENYLDKPSDDFQENRESMHDVAKSLENNYKTKTTELPPDFDLKYTTSDRYEEYQGDSAWGYNFSVNYKRKARFVKEERDNFADPAPGFSPELEEKEKTKFSTDFSIMGNLVYEAGDNNKYESTTILSRSTDDTTYKDTYYSSDADNNVTEYGLQWEERQLLSQQFRGEHLFPDQDDLKLEWQGTMSLASRDSPDTRTYEFLQQAFYDPDNASGPSPYTLNDRNNKRTWEKLEDTATSISVDLTQPIYDMGGVFGEFKTGILYEGKSRQSDTYNLEWNRVPNSLKNEGILNTDDPADVYVEENLGTGFSDIRMNNNTLGADSYKGTELFTAGYAMADLTLTSWMKMMLGVRYETSFQQIETYEDRFRTAEKSNKLEDDFLLPALNITFPFREGEQFRVAYSQTINRPMLKELSESTYIDPDTKEYYTGNPDLQIAEIQNFDLRWEKYLSSFENISFALFYKEFTNPIEIIEKPTLNRNPSYTYENVKEATNKGAEIQGRFWLSRFMGKTMSPFYLGFNGSVIHSNINLAGAENNISTNTERPLQGQSPWVVNLNLGYENLVDDIKANLLYNKQGEYITKAGAKESPTATFGVEDTYLFTPGSLNFVYSQLVYFGAEDKLYMKFKLQNLLDEKYEERINGKVTKSYYKGVDFKVTFSYSWI